jgi:hypothetical protein
MKNNANEIILDSDRKPTIEYYNSFIDDVKIAGLLLLCFTIFYVLLCLVMAIY